MTAPNGRVVRRLTWPSMSYQQASVARTLFYRRAPWNILGFEVGLALPAATIPAPFVVSLNFAAGPARLTAPWPLIQQVLTTLDAAAAAATNEAALILLELSLEPQLSNLDRVLPGWTSDLADAHPLEDSAVLGFQCRKGNEAYNINLELSPGTQSAVAAALSSRAPARGILLPITLTLSFRVGMADLSIGDIRGLNEGDVILPSVGGLNDDVIVVAAEYLCWRGTVGKERLVLTSSGQPAGRSGLEDWTMQGPIKRSQTEAPPDATLDELPIRVAFEVGRLDVPIGELATLLPGYVFALGREATSPVDILANGRRIGQGEVVSIGDSLGVRVLKLGP